MAHCNLCNKNTRCSCKGGWCPNCNSTNKQISFLNDLLKFWLDKQYIVDNLIEVRWYEWKIDSYTAYEYFHWDISEEDFNKAIEEYKLPKKKTYKSFRESEIIDVSNRVNPTTKHEFMGTSPWSRCQFCRWIKKYVEKTECPAYKKQETLDSTDTKND